MKILKQLVWVLAVAMVSTTPVWAEGALLRNGEQIDIRLGGVPQEEISQISGQHQVDGEGFVNLPHIGKIKANGVTQSALQQAIENAYRSNQIYSNPTVTVNVASAARFVNVGGDVRGPRRVEFTPDLTILSAITACGGFTEYADQKKVRLLRDGSVSIHNITEIRVDPTKDIRLKPGDSVEVPQSFW